MPVEITGAWVRAEKGIVGRVVLGWFASGSFDSQDEPSTLRVNPSALRMNPSILRVNPSILSVNLKPRPPKERRRADPGLPTVELVARMWGLIEV